MNQTYGEVELSCCTNKEEHKCSREARSVVIYPYIMLHSALTALHRNTTYQMIIPLSSPMNRQRGLGYIHGVFLRVRSWMTTYCLRRNTVVIGMHMIPSNFHNNQAWSYNGPRTVIKNVNFRVGKGNYS